MENKKEMKIFLCLLRGKKRVALFIPSIFFLIFKLLTHIVMLKTINIYPLFIALSMFQMKHFRSYFDERCWNLQHWCFYCILVVAFALCFCFCFFYINSQLLCIVFLFCFVLGFVSFSSVPGLRFLELGGRLSSTSSWLL